MAFRTLTATTLLLTLALLGCGGGDDEAGSADAAATGQAAAGQAAAAITGPVAETMDAGGYTYVRVESDGRQVWAAGPETELAVGEEVTISTAMPMPNFHSGALERDFELLYFVDGFDGAAAGHGHGQGMGDMGGMTGAQHPAPSPAADVDLSGIERAEDGHTVAEIHAQATSLSDQTVRVQGKVVKYLPGIMGRNWVHVRDGSGEEGTNDLTVTTDGFAKVGDLVLVEGKLATDKDFGAGYRYQVIVEDATVTKQ